MSIGRAWKQLKDHAELLIMIVFMQQSWKCFLQGYVNCCVFLRDKMAMGLVNGFVAIYEIRTPDERPIHS